VTRCATEPMRHFESWEDIHDFHERRDFEGLVLYCEDDVRQYPDDLYAAERLADAYVLNGDYEKAIEFGTRMHRDYPEVSCFQHHILDALFAIGKSEDDFDWVARPTVVRLSSNVADRCFEFLRSKRKPRELYDLQLEIWHDEYLAFTDEEMLAYLREDPRFVIVGDHPATAEITVARRGKSRTTS
jgi:hypothetical protein